MSYAEATVISDVNGETADIIDIKQRRVEDLLAQLVIEVKKINIQLTEINDGLMIRDEEVI